MEGRDPENSKERQEGLSLRTVKRNRGKQQRPLQEKWKYQRNISSKDGTIKGRNGKDLIKTKEIKKRWKEYTEELDEKDLNDLDN